MNPREIAQRRVDKFNHSLPPKSKVTYLKSDIEGRVITTVDKPAYIQGDDTPMVVLGGIGAALLDKVEPCFGGNTTAQALQPQSSTKPSLISLFKQGFNSLIGGYLR